MVTMAFVHSRANIVEAISKEEMKLLEAEANLKEWTAEYKDAIVSSEEGGEEDDDLIAAAKNLIATAEEANANARKDISDLRTKTAAAAGGYSGSLGSGGALLHADRVVCRADCIARYMCRNCSAVERVVVEA